MRRAEQQGVAGFDNHGSVFSTVVDWRCELCQAHEPQEVDLPGGPTPPERIAVLPKGWMHVVVNRPGINRISLVCRACSEKTTIAELADKQARDHEAWLEEERRWIAETLGAEKNELLRQREALDREIAAMSAPPTSSEE